jgi:hypothetical protein
MESLFAQPVGNWNSDHISKFIKVGITEVQASLPCRISCFCPIYAANYACTQDAAHMAMGNLFVIWIFSYVRATFN